MRKKQVVAIIGGVLVVSGVAVGTLGSTFTISLEKKSYQVGEDITFTWYFNNTTKETLKMGDPNQRPGWIWDKLIKKQAYGRPLFASGEPYIWDDSTEKRAGLYANKGRNIPPGGRTSGGEWLVFIPQVKEHGLNPGLYSLQAFDRGGPPPLGGWWSNVVEFEILEPKGEEGKAWNLLSEEIKKVENRVDSLEKIRDKAIQDEFRTALREEISDLKEGPYRQIVQRYPNTNSAQVAVKHLDQIYMGKFSSYTQTLHYQRAEEEVKKVIPDSLRRKYQTYIENEKKDLIKAWGEKDFDEIMKREKEERPIIDAFKKGLRESQK